MVDAADWVDHAVAQYDPDERRQAEARAGRGGGSSEDEIEDSSEEEWLTGMTGVQGGWRRGPAGAGRAERSGPRRKQWGLVAPSVAPRI